MKRSAPIVRANIRMPLADGTRLATDVYRPAGGGSAPAVLLRTPYGKERHLAEGLGWARRGFAFVAQDVRGRYGSEGAWAPYAAERADGAAVVDWLAAQPWSDGRIVTTGGSYAAFAAWAAALSGHAAVRAVISLVPAMGSHRTMFDPAGVLNLADHVWWWMTYADGRTERPGLYEAMLRAEPALLRHLPVADLPARLWAELPGWLDPVLAGPDATPPWAIGDAELAHLAVPTLHVGGWHDSFIAQTLHQWRIAGAAASPRPTRALIVGPWTHTFAFNSAAGLGERQYGPGSRLPLGNIQVRWLRRVLEDPSAAAPEPAVRAFQLGANRWAAGDGWPPQPTLERAWYARAGGDLLADPPACGGADEFTYDPADPYPSRSRPVDQRDILARPDAARYTTPPLARDLTWCGEPVVTLHAATDGPGTDWVARLHEILPDGRALYLGHGLIDAARARARAGGALVPGAAHPYQIRLTPGFITIPAGHRLCLEIASSAFPEHARNLNTGADRYTTDATRVARQRVHAGPGMLTALTLPVVEGTDDGGEPPPVGEVEEA